MDGQWEFLNPWLDVLVLDTRLPPPHPAREQAERAFSIAPHDCLRLALDHRGLERHRPAEQVARALALIALAIRVNERVWEALRVMINGTVGAFDWQRCRPEHLEPRIQALYTGLPASERFFQPETHAGEQDPEETTSAAAYAIAMRRVHELDVSGRLEGFLIPLTVSLELPDEPSAPGVVSLFERLLTGGTVAFGAAASSRETLYRLESVRIEPRFAAHSSIFMPAAIPWPDAKPWLGFRALRRLKELGAPITVFVGDIHDEPGVLDCMAIDRSVSLYLRVTSNDGIRRVFAECGRLGERLAALTLGFCCDDLERALAATVVAKLPAVCTSLRYFELVNGLQSDMWDAVTTRNVMKRDPCLAPTSTVESFNALLEGCWLDTSRVMSTLSQWFPSLRSLTLRCYRMHISSKSLNGRSPRGLREEHVSAILASFPALESLDIECVHLTTWRVLTDAYATRGCRVRTLAIETIGLSYVPLLEALALPSSRMAHTLSELDLCLVRRGDEQRVVSALEVMLTHNAFLDCLRLRPCAWSEADCKALRSRVASRFHRQQLRKPTRERLEFRWAFLGVALRTPSLQSLGSDVLALIFALARGPLLRMVEVENM